VTEYFPQKLMLFSCLRFRRFVAMLHRNVSFIDDGDIVYKRNTSHVLTKM